MAQKHIVGIIGKPGSGKETVGNMIAARFGHNAFRATFSGPLTQFLVDMGYRKDEIDRPLLQRLGQMLVKHFRPDAVTCGILNLIGKTDKPYIIVDGIRWPSDYEKLARIGDYIAVEKNTGSLRDLWRALRARMAFGKTRKFLVGLGWSEQKIDNETLRNTTITLGKHFGEGFFAPAGVRQLKESPLSFCMIFVDVSPQERFERLRTRKQRAGEAELTWEEFLKQDSAPNEQYIPELAKKADFTVDNEKRDPSLKNLREQVDVFCKKSLGVQTTLEAPLLTG